jgi:hypothetical protein
MQSSQNKLSEREIAIAWANITIKRWRKKIDRMKIGQHSSRELFRSFQYNVQASAGGDVQKIEFAFRFYGKFVDMGVGRGTKVGDQPMSYGMGRLSGKFLGMKRTPKKWYSKTLYSETQRLVEILQEEYGHRGQIIISENINDNAIH